MVLGPIIDRQRQLIGHTRITITRMIALHPSVWWIMVALVAAMMSWSIHQRLAAVDLARDRWGDQIEVVVADRAFEPGDPITVHTMTVPAALVPDQAISDPSDADHSIARGPIDEGTIITWSLITPAGPLALVPPEWRVVAVVESPSSGATTGERVDLVHEGVLLAADAIVIGDHEDATLVAVPADHAAQIALAAETGLSLVRVP